MTGARDHASLLAPALCLAILASPGHAVAGSCAEELIQALDEVDEALLLDVGIAILDPGLDEEAEVEELEKRGVFPYLRKSEVRWIPFELKNTLETSGFWGAVRVVPDATAAVDLVVGGEIVKSTGKDLVLQIHAEDSTGRVWIRDRKYKSEANPNAYEDADEAIVEVEEPFCELYNEIANDLLLDMQKLDPDEIASVRTVTELKFAEDLAPDAFAGFLERDRKGRYSVERLPAEDDPMVARVLRVRETDYEFIDTLNEYYAGFCNQMDSSYDVWRAYSYEEQLALEKVRRKARTRKILGALLLFGGAVAGSESSSSVADVAADAAQIAGGLLIVSGIAKGQDIKGHKESLRELAGSLDAEVEPILDEVEGRTLELSGSAETQYAEFRRLLREIFASEVGLPLDADGVTPTTQDP
jgi:hypothetical protein